MRKLLLLTGYLVLLSGCDLFGPTPQEVKDALEAVGRGVDSSTANNQQPEIHNMYANAADLTYTSKDRSTIHNISFMLDNEAGLATFKGDCNFSDYTDATSGYKINGKLTYTMQVLKNAGIDNSFGEFNYNILMSGGKITSLEFIINKNKDGVLENSLVANGKKIDLDKWEKAFDMIKSFNNPMFPRI